MEEGNSRKRQRKIKWAAGLFVALLVAFTLAGNTIQALTLPKVYTIQVATGQLNHSYKGSAVLRPGYVRDLNNPAGWKVSTVLVKTGDVVKKGQSIVEYDDGDSQAQIADARDSLKKTELSMDQLQFAYIEAANAEDEEAKKSAAASIEIAKLDMAAQKRHIGLMEKDLASNRQLRAPFDGIVAEVHAIEGLGASGEPDVRLSRSAEGLSLEATIPADVAKFLAAGEKTELLLEGAKPTVIEGIIDGIEQTQSPLEGNSEGAGQTDSYRVSFAVRDPAARSGDKVTLNLSKSDAGDGILVPNGAVHEENGDKYVYALEQRQGPLGNAYYVVKIAVEASEANAGMTSVTSGLFDRQEIVFGSSEPVLEGDRVRL